MVGIGPGDPSHRTRRAEEAIAESDVVIGYRTYIDLITDLTAGKEVIASGMRQEVQRCREALTRAEEGCVVALVSSGDPGIYGMAGLAIELAAEMKCGVAIELIPGVTAASAAAAALGAPLMQDFAVISLSDLLVPWEKIRSRLEAVAAADMVVALYNPRSRKRVRQFDEAVSIFLQHRPGSTPVGVVTAAGCDKERMLLTTLDQIPCEEVGMRSVVIIANRDGHILDGKLVTRRGYSL